jgi:hypothetical protein
MEFENSGNTGKVALWFFAGGLGVVVGVFCIILFCIGGLVWLGSPPQDIALSVKAPAQMEVGEDLTLEARVVNNSVEQVKLSSIDISLTYLDGIVITSSDPAYKSVASYSSDFQTYYFDEVIAPGASLVITFMAEAVRTGDLKGELSACIGSDFSCIDNILRTVVR